MHEAQRDAIFALLDRSGREFLPLRRSFVQQRTQGGGPGPLAGFVNARRRRALDLYLLLHALASSPPYDVALPAAVCARLLGLSSSGSGSVISKQWSWLESQRLIRSRRYKRLRRVTLLREDGSGTPYVHPGVAGASDVVGDYFKVPYAYWRGGFQDRIDLSSKAVLLVALSLQDDFILPLDHGAKWYGISRDSMGTGLRTLRALGVLSMRVERRAAPLTARGYFDQRRYTLRPPFRPESEPPGPEKTAGTGT